MEETWTNNEIEIVGTLSGVPEFSHKSRNESYYIFTLEVDRLSGNTDKVNVIARGELMESTEITPGGKVAVWGELRSFNNKSGKGSKLIITVFAKRIEIVDGEDKNTVSLRGVMCKPPNFRRTPMGREICDLMLAVVRRYGRSDYLPCIAWGPHAAKTSLWDVGTQVRLEGRLQSRNYIKNDNGVQTERTAFEVSIMEIEAE